MADVNTKPTHQAGDLNGQTERRDRTPLILQALGIGRKEWQYITKPQLDALNQPGQSPHIRIWSVGIQHSIAYGRECAVKQVPVDKVKKWMEILGEGTWLDEQGQPTGTYKLVPLSPSDIGKLTNPPLSKSEMTSGIDRLEREGLARQENQARGTIRLLFYVRPRKALPNLVQELDNQNEECDANRVLTPQESMIALVARIRKSYLPKLSLEAVPLPPDLVGNQDNQKIIEEDAKAALEVGVLDFQRRCRERLVVWEANRLVVKNGDAYKEESFSKRDTLNGQYSIPETVSSSSALPLVDNQKAEEEDHWQKFKNTYPTKRLDEAKAKSLFDQLSSAEQISAVTALRERYTGCERWLDRAGQWIPFASTFLRARAFDFDPPARMRKAQSRAEEVEQRHELNQARIEAALRKEKTK